MIKYISKLIYYKLLGWKTTGFSDFSQVKKAFIIAVPHTSLHDFYIGVLLRSVLGIQANFVGKKSLFNPLTGWLFKALGGAPVVRKTNEKQVDAIARLFQEKGNFEWLLLQKVHERKLNPGKQDFIISPKKQKYPYLCLLLILKIKKISFLSHFTQLMMLRQILNLCVNFMKV